MHVVTNPEIANEHITEKKSDSISNLCSLDSEIIQ